MLFFSIWSKNINKLQVKLVRKLWNFNIFFIKKIKFDLVNFKIKLIFDKSLFISINVKLYTVILYIYVYMFIYNYCIQLFAYVCNFFQIIKMIIYHNYAIK